MEPEGSVNNILLLGDYDPADSSSRTLIASYISFNKTQLSLCCSDDQKSLKSPVALAPTDFSTCYLRNHPTYSLDQYRTLIRSSTLRVRPICLRAGRLVNAQILRDVNIYEYYKERSPIFMKTV